MQEKYDQMHFKQIFSGEPGAHFPCNVSIQNASSYKACQKQLVIFGNIVFQLACHLIYIFKWLRQIVSIKS